MKTALLGTLSIGTVPRVVGTISSFESLRAIAALRGNRYFDIIEVRLDQIGEEHDWLNLCRTIEDSGVPIILTLRSASEGGKCERSDAQRLEIFKSALTTVSAVDIEFKSGLALQAQETARDHGKAILVSFHDFTGTPSAEILTGVARQASQQGSIVKISTMVTSADDCEILRNVLLQDRDFPICVIGMGSRGTHTRTSFPHFGSCLTYGYLDVPSAPGQLRCSALVEHLRETNPTYNEQFIDRNKILEYV